jgi:hypothetical protein
MSEYLFWSLREELMGGEIKNIAVIGCGYWAKI